MKLVNIFDMPCGASGSANTADPSSPRNEMWMWQLLPSRSSYFAMNVRDLPCWSAISLAPFL